MATRESLSDAPPPVQFLTVPGLNNSGPGHWQTRWEQALANCHRAELGLWDKPVRTAWVNQLNLAIARTSAPTILIAHSLGCLAVAWWAAMERPGSEGRTSPVVGALLVAPPDVDCGVSDPGVAGFAPAPRGILPFPSILVASRNDPWCSLTRARRLADFWGSRFADAGAVGNINAESGLGDWSFGQFLLEQVQRMAGLDLQPGAFGAGGEPLPERLSTRSIAERVQDAAIASLSQLPPHLTA